LKPNSSDTLNEMIEALRGAGPETLPSDFWNSLNRLNLEQLADFGFENFKRTIARNYFTWVVSPRDDQIRYLVRQLPLWATARAARNALLGGTHPPISLKHSLYYNLLTYLLWEFVWRRSGLELVKQLEEPVEGNPPALRWKGRRISQDLANSILEYQSIVQSGIDLRGVRTIMELGAGYGRTAFVFQHGLPAARYMVVDIPPALFVSQRYLSGQFQERRIFSFRPFSRYADVKEELESAELAFLLPHQLEQLPPHSVDLFINISSFHEMRPEQLKYYFRQVQRLTNGYVYLKQWKKTTIPVDGVVLEEKDYPVPPSWRTIFWRECQVQTRFFEALLRT
jgi:putative sugar O-methyltransferase